ncbi:MAG: patatin-like phospholipase family protein [Polyangiaceae bacterium]
MAERRHSLVLTGGGARCAYQAGALLGIAEITGARTLPFPILAGTSGGSINAAFLASRADDFQGAARGLCDLWTTIRASDVFRTDVSALTKTGVGWLSDLALGGFIGSGHAQSLLDTAPLRAFLARHLDTERLARGVARGDVRALAVTATDYHTGTAVTFFDGDASLVGWTRTNRLAVRARVTVDHIMASSAIPVFFPPVVLDGAFFADGCIRMGTPFSPAIRLGADRVLAIGIVRRSHTPDPFDLRHGEAPLAPPTHADVAGTLLGALFLDALEADFERLERINRTLALIAPTLRDAQALRRVPATMLLPREDIGALAARTEKDLPLMLRHLLEGLGVGTESGAALLSYLAFDAPYTTRLVDAGYEDARAAEDTIRAFFA